jgi:hypothetical protein
MDATLSPGGTVVWQYTPIPAQPSSARAAAVQNRRADRAKV